MHSDGARARLKDKIMKSLLLASSLLASLSVPAFAADLAPTADATVDSVIVTGRRDPEEPPVVGDARQRLSETPGAVSVISQESFAKREALALDDMLRDAPGVYAQKKWGGDVRISIRGSGVGNANHNRGLLIAQDGVPLNEADGYGDSQIADPLTTRFVEVYRGGNALRFGGALLGGAINMVTPTGRTADFENQLRLDGGSFGVARENLAVARVLGDWDVYAALTNQTAQGWRPQSQQNIQFGSLNVGRSFGEGREVRFIVNGSNINQEIPGVLTWSQFQANPRQATAANYGNDQGRNQRGLRGSPRQVLCRQTAALRDPSNAAHRDAGVQGDDAARRCDIVPSGGQHHIRASVVLGPGDQAERHTRSRDRVEIDLADRRVGEPKGPGPSQVG